MDRRVGLHNRRLEQTAAIGAALITSAALLNSGASSAEAAVLAAKQPGITRSFTPDKAVPTVQDCSATVGFQIPPSAEGSIEARIKGDVKLSVKLVNEKGEELRDVTAVLLDGQHTYNQVNLQQQFLRQISSTPNEKPDFGFIVDPSEDPYKGPIGRGVFSSGQLSATLQEIRRINKEGGKHEWDPVSDFVEIVRKTSRGLKAYKNDCGGNEVIRRYEIVTPRYLKDGSHYEAGPDIEIANLCETPVTFTRKYRVMNPPEIGNQSPPEEESSPSKPAPAQTPDHRGIPAPYQTPK